MTSGTAGVLAPVLAAASGLTLLASHPPLGLWPLSFLAPPLLLAALALDARRAGEGGRVRAWRLGALAGVAAFAPMLSWLILPAGYVGWALLTLVQAAWIGLLAVLLRPWLGSPWLPIVTAIAWTGIDAWRATTPLNGFEWGAIAYAHVDGSWLLPVARLVGGRGITFLVVLIGASGFAVLRRGWRRLRERGDLPVETSLEGVRGALALLVAAMLVSVLATIEPPPQTGTLDVLVVQGNDLRHWEEEPQDPDPPLRIATALRDETLEAVGDGPAPDLTVWPESSLDRDPFLPSGEPLRELAGETADAVGALLTGASLEGPDPETQRLIAALLLDDGFEVADRYVKRRLVPFGEFVPFRSLLGWFPPLEQIPRDAIPNRDAQAVRLADDLHAAVVICFETLFPGIVRSNVLAPEEPAEVILALTNDASFGISPEPAQHLAQSRLRAVETGRYVVHAALTGRSAVVDPWGRTSHETELFTVGHLRAEVGLVEGRTPYLLIGDVVGNLTRIAAAGLAGWALWHARRRRSDPRARGR